MPDYILGESQAETERLRAQAAAVPIIERVKWAGLQRSMRVVDAGCGPGEISRVLAQLVGPQGAVDAFDLSSARLEAARALPTAEGSAKTSYSAGDVYVPPVAAGQADFVFCQFVFEYLREPQKALTALVETLKPGGILCLCDADGIGGTNWPMPESVGHGLSRVLEAMATTGFDALVGRKLYTWMVDAGLKDVQVRMDPVVTAGSSSADETANWAQRFAGLTPLGERALGSAEAYSDFVVRYLRMLADPRSLKFTNIVSVSGRRP
jgi:ubiquinone/menaquinone biosynthesis C-methylase UbiE